ncbi:hypothetical protein P8X34_10240 [Pyrococcus kukulkanii]|uniref:Uncharacterized protein n=1 Tax=Pyrococcus kukulkanii TaxID=1609559 RepID=A0ABV4T5R6_9EURY
MDKEEFLRALDELPVEEVSLWEYLRLVFKAARLMRDSGSICSDK